MRPTCPNETCSFFNSKEKVHADGAYFRKADSRWIKRFKCTCCNKKFSHATTTLEFRQKKRKVNSQLKNLLASGVSMRRCARLLKINRKTVARKLVYLASKANLSQDKFLKLLRGKISIIQFDDLITSEHSKLKPLTVSIAVDAKKRFILGARVGRIPAFGHLAKISREKYGQRENEHLKTLDELFKILKGVAQKKSHLISDEHKNYPPFVRKYLPDSKYECFKGERSSVAGQGELKKVVWDPLFTINHTCAMLRANISRLIRRTWCTTKKKEFLQMHLDIFVDFYNQSYLK